MGANPFKETKIGDMKLGDMKIGDMNMSNLGNSSLNNSVIRAVRGRQAQESIYQIPNTSFMQEFNNHATRRQLNPFNALSLEFRDQDMNLGAQQDQPKL